MLSTYYRILLNKSYESIRHVLTAIFTKVTLLVSHHLANSSGGQIPSLQWRHNGHDGLSSHKPPDCLLKRLFRHSSKQTPRLRVSGLCEGNSTVTDEFPAQRASNAENVSIWWCHPATTGYLIFKWKSWLVLTVMRGYKDSCSRYIHHTPKDKVQIVSTQDNFEINFRWSSDQIYSTQNFARTKLVGSIITRLPIWRGNNYL